MNRRALFIGAGAAAMAAGAGVALWRYTPTGGESAGELWNMRFGTPQGPELAMASLRGQRVLLNFWATWCPPCVEEMPLLDAFHRANVPRGWQVVGLAIDQPSAVRNFLKKTPVSYPIGFAGLEGTELGKSLGNRSGGLPFTVILGADGSVRHRRMGRVSEDDLRQWADLR